LFKNLHYIFIDKILRLVFGLFITSKIISHLGPNNFGIISYVLVIVYFITPLINLGFDSILLKELVVNKFKSKEFISTAILLRLTFGFILSFLCFIIFKYVYKIDDFLLLSTIILLFNATLISINGVFDSYFQSLNKNYYSIVLQFSPFLLVLLLRLYLIKSNASLFFFVGSYLVESIICLILMLSFYNFKFGNIKLKFNIEISKNLILNGIPIIISVLAIAVFTKVDQFFIKINLGYETLGLYTAALRISDLLFIIPITLNTIFYPNIIVVYLNAVKNHRIIYAFSTIFYLSLLVSGVTFILSHYIITFLYGDGFELSTYVLRIFSLLSILNALGVFISSLLFSKNLHKFATISAIIGGFASVSLNYLLTPLYGISGVLFCAVVSQCLSLFSLFIISKKAREIIPIFISSLNLFRLIKFLNKFYKLKL
jgi:O-antigen/teichoic acid export membrane protein